MSASPWPLSGWMCVGDVQGCHAQLARLNLPDNTVFIGDAVNRGPASLAVVQALARTRPPCLLGNHDLYLLACVAGARAPRPSDTLQEFLQSGDREALTHFLRHQRLAHLQDQTLFVHAGVVPQWTAQDTLERAAEVEQVLRSDRWIEFMHNLWGNTPDRWDDQLTGWERLRCIVNILTRMRYCTPDGTLDMVTKESMGGPPPGFMPWFDVPGRGTQDVTVVFGHWSTMGLINRPNLVGLDTGCVWGGKLTAVKLHQDWSKREFIQVKCAGYASPDAG